MQEALLEKYDTLTLEAKQEVQHLIYFLSSQQEKKSSPATSNEKILDTFLGSTHSWNNEDALEYQKNLRTEERA